MSAHPSTSVVLPVISDGWTKAGSVREQYIEGHISLPPNTNDLLSFLDLGGFRLGTFEANPGESEGCRTFVY